MCVKLLLGYLNLSHCPPYLTSTYTCKVTIASRVCGSQTNITKIEAPVQIVGLF